MVGFLTFYSTFDCLLIGLKRGKFFAFDPSAPSPLSYLYISNLPPNWADWPNDFLKFILKKITNFNRFYYHVLRRACLSATTHFRMRYGHLTRLVFTKERHCNVSPRSGYAKRKFHKIVFVKWPKRIRKCVDAGGHYFVKDKDVPKCNDNNSD